MANHHFTHSTHLMDNLRQSYFLVMEELTITYLIAQACHLAQDEEGWCRNRDKFYQINDQAEQLENLINSHKP
jgi:hypothetical protein